MPTKEEILKANHAKKVMNWDKVFVQNPSIIESAYEAMDIYAKQECIAFAKFVMDKTLQDCNTDDKWTLDDFSEVTDEQLYELYQQSLNT